MAARASPRPALAGWGRMGSWPPERFGHTKPDRAAQACELAITPDPLFPPAIPPPPVEHVQLLRVEVEAGDAVAVTVRPLGVRVGHEVGAGPAADLLGQGRRDEKLDLPGACPGFVGFGGGGHGARYS